MSHKERCYNIEFVTPAFVAGADQNTPELRVPSIRGSLRWWFRLGLRDQRPDVIAEREEELFGSTKVGQRLLLKVDQSKHSAKVPFKETAVKYLWFSLKERASALSPKSRFTLAVATRSTSRSPEGLDERLEAIDKVVWQWVLFGGLGSRSRRAAGALWFADSLPDEQPLPAGKDKIEALLREKAEGLPIEFTLSDKLFDTWLKAVEAVYKHYRGRRQRIKSSSGQQILPALGFAGDIRADNEKRTRLGSPIMLKVIPDNRKFRWLMVAVTKPFAENIESKKGKVFVSKVVTQFVADFEQATYIPPHQGDRHGSPRQRRS